MVQREIPSSADFLPLVLYEDMTEAELISEAKSGDIDAYGELFSRHRGVIEAFLRRHSIIDEVDDMVQDTFLNIFRNLDRFHDEGNGLLGYSIVTARNINRDRLKRARLKTISLDTYDEGEEPAVSERVSWEDRIINEMTTSSIMVMLADCISGQNLLIFQQWIDNVPLKEIARQVNMSEGSIKQRIHRIKARVRKLYDEQPVQMIE